MKLATKILTTLAVLFIPTIAIANLSYNPEHDEALKHLKAVESASVNMQYNCGKYSLIISAYATESDINGRRASVTGKIVAEDDAHDISEQLEKAISRDDILTGKMSVACNADKGAFEIKKEAGDAIINIFSDGVVEGSRGF